MARRYYVNAAPQVTLSSTINAAATSMTVTSFAGWPASYPFHAVLEYGTGNMEIVLVTAVTGSTATVTRAQDGTLATTHNAGATVDHAVVAKDMDETSAHVNGTSGVHGAAGAVVGTTDVQTLTNKTLTTPVVNGTVTGTGTFQGSGGVNTAGPVAGAAVSGTTGTFSGAVSAASVAVTGASTAASYAANGDGTVAGVFTPKVYANTTARDTALPSPAAGTLVWMTTGPDGAGLYYYFGGVWTRLTNKLADLPDDTTGNNTGLGISAASGWSVNDYQWRDRKGWRQLAISLKRTGSAITFGSDGALADAAVFSTSDAGLTGGLIYSAGWRATITSGMGFFDNTGTYLISDGHPTSSINTNHNLTLFVVYAH